MCRLQQIRKNIQKVVADQVPVRLRHRMVCGMQAFSLQAFSSINANGRSLATNRKTGESRAYRVLHDSRSAPLLFKLLLWYLPKSPLLYCSLDHSQFGPFCVAVLAVSLRKGRAIPIWCQINVSQAGLMRPLLTALKELAKTIPPDQRLVLVMDRWFCGRKLFELIQAHGWYFICRTKFDRRVEVPWENGSVPVGEVSREETGVFYFGMPLRLIRSNVQPGMKQQEPWFLLTNLPEEVSRIQILHRYADRFEIEECFKDMKWLQRLEWQQVRNPSVMQTLLLFVFFGWWLFWVVFHPKPTRNIHPKHRLSWFREAWETLYRLSWPDTLRFTSLSP